MGTRTIKVDYLARVEGEGAMRVRMRNGQVTDVQLKIFEPPRFFEAFLQGRRFTEAPDITARICGICPVAYQMSAVHAMERALNVTITPEIRELRRLLYCGEWIESHTLHVVMLHAPDFLGLPSAIELAEQNPELVQRMLQLKKVGNDLVNLVGGREIHPINVRVGGFYRAPEPAALQAIRPRVAWAREAALELTEWVSGFDFPSFEQSYEFVAVSHPDEYPFNEGHVASSEGLDIDVADYEAHFEEQHVAHSNALHSVLRARGSYMTGPLARYALHQDKLSPQAREAARRAGLGPVCRNPFRSIIVRAVELVFACEEALRITDSYRQPEEPAMPVVPRGGRGMAATEAPRGLLYHRYDLDGEGLITEAKIVPPTSQNQKKIEDDLHAFVGQHMHLDDTALQWQCEQAIRNYDPCISCATHFLKLEVDRG